MTINQSITKGSISRRLADVLRHDILEGRFSVAEPFPSLRDLSEKHGVGMRTVRTATDLLAHEGLLYRRERSGTFVRIPPPDVDSRPALRCVNIIERPTGTFPAFVRIDYLRGYTQALETFPVKMRVCSFMDESHRLAGVFSDQYSFQEQGCVLVNIVDANVFEWMKMHRVPFVSQNFTRYEKSNLPPHHSVVIDKVGGAYQATEYLIALGHRRIGYAGYAPGSPEDLTEVYEGYESAMRRHGLTPRPGDIMPVNTDEPPMAYDPALRWMRDRELPSAFVARTDSGAIGILRAARTLGLRVPEDLSVVGFNDQHEALATEPPLTTIGVPRVQMGRTAVEILLNSFLNDANDAPQSRVMRCQLIERHSAGPPPIRKFGGNGKKLYGQKKL